MPKRKDINKILVIGAGPIIIGQACEFDYSGVQACKSLKEEGYEIILINSNPATIMTDPEVAHKTYIEPINSDFIEKISIAHSCPHQLQTLAECAQETYRADLEKKSTQTGFCTRILNIVRDTVSAVEPHAT